MGDKLVSKPDEKYYRLVSFILIYLKKKKKKKKELKQNSESFHQLKSFQWIKQFYFKKKSVYLIIYSLKKTWR